MGPKRPFAALPVAVMPGPAAHAELAPRDSGPNPVVRTVFDQPINVAGNSLETGTVRYSPWAKGAAHDHAMSNPFARDGCGLCYGIPRMARFHLLAPSSSSPSSRSGRSVAPISLLILTLSIF